MKLHTAIIITLMQLAELNCRPVQLPYSSGSNHIRNYRRNDHGINKASTTCQTPSLVGYWGQNSAGLTTPDRNKWEKTLDQYCSETTYDMIHIGFLNIFPSDVRNPGTVKPPTINLSYHCETTFDEFPFLLKCPDVAKQIQICQSRGKKIVLSIGGATGPYGFSSDAEAATFAKTYWDMFLGGKEIGVPRPFGDVILDGVDLDIEAGSNVGYATFVKKLREFYAGGTRQYVIAGAPQCVFPDAYLGPGAKTALQETHFDVLTIQFYNNYCGVNNPTSFNYEDWETWANTISVNPDVKLYVGVPSAPAAAGSGYIDIEKLKLLTTQLATKKHFGGVMLWECSLAEKNIGAGGLDYASEIKAHLKQICSGGGDGPIVKPTQTAPIRPPPVRTTALPPPPPPIFTPPTTTRPVFTVNPIVTTSMAPTPTGSPGDPQSGDACDPTNDMLGTCSGDKYAQCLFGEWILRDCAPGTVCKKNPNGGFLCDFA